MLYKSYLEFCILISFAAIISVNCSFDADLTVDIGPGRRECFHQTVKKGKSFEIEYQVYHKRFIM